MKAKLAVQLYGESLVGRRCFVEQCRHPATIAEIVPYEFNPNGEAVVARDMDGYEIDEGDELSFDYSALRRWDDQQEAS